MRNALALIALFALSGCWSDEQAIGTVAWSDDDLEQVYIHMYYEEKDAWGPYGMGHETKNHEYEVYAQAPDGSGRHRIVSRRPGLQGGILYYMRDAGYLLWDAGGADGAIRWEKVDLPGGTVHLVREWSYGPGPATPCQSFEVLPSPDGATIGLFERVPPAGNGCNGGTFEIDLLDAATLATEASFSMPMNDMPGVIWNREGDLVVWSWASNEAWRIDPTLGPVSTTVPTCQWPRTSSSTLSGAGVMIAPGTLDNPVDVVDPNGDNCWY